MKLEISPELEIQVGLIAAGRPCAVVDDFLLNPEAAVEYACAHADAFLEQERAYPGCVLPVPDEPMRPVYDFLRKEMSRLFPFCRGGIHFHTQFSLATLQPADFSWIQRLCHTDPQLAPGRANYAALLYLFEDPGLGGTGFYRWRDPEYWQQMTALQRDDPEAGLEELQERFAMFREPPRYMTASNEAAELLDQVPARYNRLVFYSGDLPHSAYIEHPGRLSADPARGRLTLNCFLDTIPRQ